MKEIKLIALKRASMRLEEVLERQPDEARFIIDATIQRFEFTFELFWKVTKALLATQGYAVTFPKETLRAAYGAGWLGDDDQIWLDMLEDRNLSSHVYKEEMADQIYKRIQKYLPVLQQAVVQLESFYKAQ